MLMVLAILTPVTHPACQQMESSTAHALGNR
jgi:hypothetical protein